VTGAPAVVGVLIGRLALLVTPSEARGLRATRTDEAARRVSCPSTSSGAVVKERSGYRLTAVHITVVCGDPDEVLAQVGGHTSSVERTNLTARQMNGRLVGKTRSYSKRLDALAAACAWEDWVYNLTRTVDTLSIPDRDARGRRRWQRQTPAMEAGLTAHRWTITEPLTTVVPLLPLLPLNRSTRNGEKTWVIAPY